MRAWVSVLDGGVDRRALAWAFYDWANSAYATVVMAGFFPAFFRDFWSTGQASSAITFHLGLANSLASVIIVVLAPFMGAVADRGGARKRFLLTFAALGVVMSGGLFWVAKGQWQMAAALYVLATIGFMGANVFYDALLTVVAPPRDYDRVSALGYALGYLGGGVLFALCVVMFRAPQTFGLAGGAQAVQVSFVLVALWWAVFTVPLALSVREPPSERGHGIRHAVRAGLDQLRETLAHVRRLHTVALFLLAYWLYIDGVDTIVRMAVDYGKALGFDTGDLILALLVTQFVGFPATLAFGLLAARIGTKRGIFLAIGLYIAIVLWGSTIEATWEFYVLAAAIGLVQGGIQSSSRAFYARLVPPERAGELFGFYNMLGKFAAILGPVLVGWVGVLSGSPRVGIASIVVLFIAGGVLLMRVDERASPRQA